ncbi:MAG: hypothetical protein ABL867_11600 [Rickettsiales bacterium]
MHKHTRANSYPAAMKIESFDDIQARYQMMPLANRAMAVISDAKPALNCALLILRELAKEGDTRQAITNLRHNAAIISRIRPSEAKTTLMDKSVDFIKTAENKLMQWHKTLDLIAHGNAKATLVTNRHSEQHCVVSVSSYLPLIKLVIIELSALNKNNIDTYNKMLAEIRRCTTILSDCECASELDSIVLH